MNPNTAMMIEVEKKLKETRADCYLLTDSSWPLSSRWFTRVVLVAYIHVVCRD